MQLEFNFFIFMACKWDIVPITTFSEIFQLMLIFFNNLGTATIVECHGWHNYLFHETFLIIKI